MKRAWSLCLAGVLRPPSSSASRPRRPRRASRSTSGRARERRRREGSAAARRAALASTRGFTTLGRRRSAPRAAKVGVTKIFLSWTTSPAVSVHALHAPRIGTHVEVWVQNNLNFPDGDCRNDGVRNVVTDAQVDYLVDEFDTNIYPKESAAFSVPPDRDGTCAARGAPGHRRSGITPTTTPATATRSSRSSRTCGTTTTTTPTTSTPSRTSRVLLVPAERRTSTAT